MNWIRKVNKRDERKERSRWCVFAINKTANTPSSALKAGLSFSVSPFAKQNGRMARTSHQRPDLVPHGMMVFCFLFFVKLPRKAQDNCYF
jgi:hypothetical protein